MLLHIELFTDGWMPLRMAGKRQLMPLTVEPQHWLWMNATWSKWNLSLNVHTVFHAWQLQQKSESLQEVFALSSSTAWGNKKFVQNGFHMYSMMAKELCVFFLPPPIYSIGEMKTMHFLSHFNGWQVMDAFIWHSAAKTECWMACPKNTWEENCSESHACHVLQLKWTHAWPTTINGQ